MVINPVSSVSAIYGAHQAQNQDVPKRKAGSSQNPRDTVHLSAAAQAELQGVDSDGDGDGH